jgi:hypothetical protein
LRRGGTLAARRLELLDGGGALSDGLVALALRGYAGSPV